MDSHFPEMYRAILPGSQIDHVHGVGYDPEMSLTGDVDLDQPRDVSRSQLAAGLLPFRSAEKAAPLEVITLEADDPWRGIYLTCLGKLSEKIDPDIVRAGNWLPARNPRRHPFHPWREPEDFTRPECGLTAVR